jgi:autotransporter translocation and assembly factor TamB
MKIKTVKKAGAFLALALLAVGLFLALRSPNISNLLKRLILPEFERATGYQMIADKLYLNLLPLFVEAKGVKVFDSQGQRVFTAEAVKAYLEGSALLRGELRLSRMLLKRPRVWLGPERLRELSALLAPAAGGRTLLGVLEVRGGEGSYYQEERELLVEVSAVDAQLLLKDRKDLRFSAFLKSTAQGMPTLEGALRGALSWRQGRLEVRSLRLSSGGSELELSGGLGKTRGLELALEADLKASTFKELLSLRGPGQGRLRLQGTLRSPWPPSLGDTTVDVALQGSFAMESLFEALRTKRLPERLKGMVFLKVSARGPLAALEVEGTGRLQESSIYRVQVQRADFAVRYSQGLLEFPSLRASLYGGRARGSVGVRLPKGRPVELSLEFEGLGSQEVAALVGLQRLVPEGRLKGALYSKARGFSPIGWFSHQSLGSASVFPGFIQAIEAGVAVEGKVVRLSGLRVEALGGSAAWAEGFVDTRAKYVQMHFEAESAELSRLLAAYVPALQGRARMRGTLKGPYRDLTIEGQVRCEGLRYKGYGFGSLEGGLSYRKELLELSGLRAVEGSKEVHAQGQVRFPRARGLFDLRAPEYALKLQLKEAELKGLLTLLSLEGIPLEGSLEATFTLEGEHQAPVLRGSASLLEAYWKGYGFEVFRTGFSFRRGRLTLQEAMLKRGRSYLRLDGSVDLQGRYEFQVFGQGLRLSDLSPRPLQVDYVLAVSARGQGSLEEPALEARVELSQGRFRGQSLGGGLLRGSLGQGQVQWQGSLLDGKVSLHGSMELWGELPWVAEVRLRKGIYSALIAGSMEDVPEDLLLSMRGRASLRGSRRSVEAAVRLDHLGVALYGQSFSATEPVLLEFRQGLWHLRKLSLRGGQSLFTVQGVVGKELDLLLDGQAGLSPLAGFSKALEHVGGQARFVLHLGGTLKRPVLNGGLQISGGSVGLKGIPQRLSHLEGYLYVDGNKVVLQELSGNLGGGDVVMSGLMYLEGLRPKRTYVDVMLANVSGTYQGLFLLMGGNLLLRATEEGATLVGELQLKRALYKRPLKWKGWFATSGAAAGRPAPEALKAVRLSIRLYGSEDIVVDNNIASTALRVDLTLRGTLARPVPLGEVEALRGGRVFFRNTEFVIERAQVLLSDPLRLRPYVRLMAATEVKGYRVRLSLEGSMGNFTLALSSEPPLDEMDILALLTVGEFGQGLRGLEGSIGAAEAASFLTGQFQDVLKERLRHLTGFDRFQVDPYVSKSAGTVLPRVTVSKRLGKRLVVTYSASVGGEEQVIRLNYQLTPHVALQGLRDELGGAGLDVKFRFRFR